MIYFEYHLTRVLRFALTDTLQKDHGMFGHDPMNSLLVDDD